MEALVSSSKTHFDLPLRLFKILKHVLPYYFQDLNIKLKWPNDIYAKGTKIGGLIVNSMMDAEEATCNIGVGINFTNSSPTTCVNDLISAYNKKYSKSLPLLTYEKSLANIFNEIEYLFKRIQANDDLDFMYDLYYKNWLHRYFYTFNEHFQFIIGLSFSVML